MTSESRRCDRRGTGAGIRENLEGDLTVDICVHANAGVRPIVPQQTNAITLVRIAVLCEERQDAIRRRNEDVISSGGRSAQGPQINPPTDINNIRKGSLVVHQRAPATGHGQSRADFLTTAGSGPDTLTLQNHILQRFTQKGRLIRPSRARLQEFYDPMLDIRNSRIRPQ